MFNNICILLFSVFYHPYHVSVTEVNYNNKAESLEITFQIFIDDLESALRNNYDPEIGISDISDDRINNYIEKYLLSETSIKVNGIAFKGNYLGWEIEEDAVLAYIEVEHVEDIENINIMNKLLTEVYQDQVNLVHFEYFGKIKTLKLSKQQPDGQIEVEEM